MHETTNGSGPAGQPNSARGRARADKGGRFPGAARPAPNLGGSLEAGNAWDEIGRALPERWVPAASAFVAVDTLVGPVHLAVGRAEGHPATVYFYLGRVLP